jgi:hypothetical protein
VFSVCCVFSSRCLVTASNAVDSSASVFTPLRAAGCLIAPPGRNFWPLTASHIWPPLATTRCLLRLALTSDSELVCLKTNCPKVRVEVTTDGQSASLSWCQAPSGAQDQIFVTVDSCGFVDVECPFWREDGSVVYNCCWPSPAQAFSGSSPYFTVSKSRLLQPRVPGPRIYYTPVTVWLRLHTGSAN